jgi:hypothetical protein
VRFRHQDSAVGFSGTASSWPQETIIQTDSACLRALFEDSPEKNRQCAEYLEQKVSVVTKVTLRPYRNRNRNRYTGT